jgi:hypothetical protein
MWTQRKFLNLINVYGFGIIKNGVKFDFPYKESLFSMKPIVQNVYYVLGDSADSTNDFFKDNDFCKVEHSVWDKELQKGLVLSVETNKALSFLRKSISNSNEYKNAWGIYLQADEVLHEDDYELLLNDFKKANSEGYDAISFRYLHFWQTHHQIAISKTWYPTEVRAIKLDTPIESWGDAQGFNHIKKIFYTEARIFHYGHVREASAYAQKMHTMGTMYHKGFKFWRKKFLSFFKKHQHQSILFFGTHPAVMKERILRMNDIWELPECDVVYIVGNKEKYSEKFHQSINVKNVFWVSELREVPESFRDLAVVVELNKFGKMVGKSSVPNKMQSPLAHDWNAEFKLTLLLSEKNIGLKKI